MAASPRICEVRMRPLQSGSHSVVAHAAQVPAAAAALRLIWIATARRVMPEAAIGVDDGGLPGETDEEFAQSRDFIGSLPFTYLHVVHLFGSAWDPGGRAAEGQVPVPVRRSATGVLRELAEAKNPGVSAEYGGGKRVRW